jgi:glycerol uptake facilitator-like aquaporin
MFARKVIDLPTLLAYWIAQLIGASLGLYLGYALSGATVAPAVANIPSQSGAFIGELLATTVLVLIILRLASTKRESKIPFAVGLWVFAASTFTLTGAQANPAVTFAFMVRDGFTQNPLLIVLAEFLGALIALAYVIVLDSSAKAKKKKK